MSRQYFRWNDQFPTITMFLSKASDTTKKTWIGWIPFNTLFLDHRPGVVADIGFVLDVAFGSTSNLLSTVRLKRYSNSLLPAYSSTFDPRKIARAGIGLEVEIEASTALVQVPLILYVIGVATDESAISSIMLPMAITNTNPWTVNDIALGTVPAYWIEKP